MDETEGEIWPNPISITCSPVGNVTEEASAHAQHKFGAVKADFVAYNKLTTDLLHDLGIFARISNFVAFTKPNKHKMRSKGFFLQLGRICFRKLLRQSENFSHFCKVFRKMIVPFYTSPSARSLNLPSISHTSF